MWKRIMICHFKLRDMERLKKYEFYWTVGERHRELMKVRETFSPFDDRNWETGNYYLTERDAMEYKRILAEADRRRRLGCRLIRETPKKKAGNERKVTRDNFEEWMKKRYQIMVVNFKEERAQYEREQKERELSRLEAKRQEIYDRINEIDDTIVKLSMK